VISGSFVKGETMTGIRTEVPQKGNEYKKWTG